MRKRQTLAVLAYAWVLWTQTRTSGPGQPVTDAWDIVDTFETQAECESARVAIDPPAAKPEVRRPFRTRYVCFPDTQDPKATP
jgi:hypothetical protein